jgi:O-antigen/teichoic acid export membrane protein
MNIFRKLQQLPQSVKASIAFAFASFVASGISYIVTPVYTRLLLPEEYGQTSVFMTWLEIFGIMAMFCLSYGVFNNGMVDYPEQRDEYSFSMLILSNIITLCFSGILLCLYPLIAEWLKLDFAFIVLMCVVFLVQPAYNFWKAKQRYELKYKLTVCVSVCASVLSPLTAIICILANPSAPVYGRIFGAEIALICVYVVFYIVLAVKSKCKINTTYWKTALLFNLPLIPHYLSVYLLGSSDKLMISWLVGDAQTAYYAVAHSVAAVVTIVWSAINSSLIPYTYEKCKKEDFEPISRVTLPLLTLFATVCVLLIMLAPEVVAIMATPDYMEAIYAIPPIVGGVFFQVQYYIYANVVYYYKRPKYVMVASLTATVLNIVLNYVFISQFGYLAAGYTTIFCYFVQATIDYFAMRKVVGRSIYNMRYIGILSLAVVLIALLSNLIYAYAIVRYAVLAVIVVVCVLLRKKIIGLFTTMKGEKKS